MAGGGPDLPAHTMTFTPFGDLVQSVLGEEGVESRVLLMYEVDGETLVLDQPGAPKPERRPFVVDGDELRIGTEDPKVLHREPDDELSDPDAYMLALASAALHRALSPASESESFVPFLISDSPDARQVRRIIAPDVHVARAAAQNTMATLGPDVRGAAFAFQGVVEIEGEAFDAAVIEVSQRGRLYGLLLGQPFGRNEEGHLVRVTDLDVETNENWFEVDHPEEETREPAKKKAAPKKAAAKKPTAKRPAAKKAASKKPVAKKAVAKKAAAKRPAAKRPAAKRPAAKRPAAKKLVAKRPAAKKLVGKRPAAKKAAPKKRVAKKAVTKKTAAKKAIARKASNRKSRR